MPTSSSFSLQQNWTGSITETCCWYRGCYNDLQNCWRHVCLTARQVPAHRAHDTVEFLCSETPQYINPDMWPSNSCNINPVNYRIQDMLQEHVYRVPIHDTDMLRKHLQSMVDDAFDQWQKKTGSMYPCRRWLLLTLAVTLPAWHSSCHTSQPVFFRATNPNPRPSLSRANNVLKNAILSLVRWKTFAFYKVVW